MPPLKRREKPPSPGQPPGDGAERWEYWIATLVADADAEREYLEATWPDGRVAKCDAAALIPELNAYGREGWELASLHPVVFGRDASVIIAPWGLQGRFTNSYLCAFNRRVRE